MNRLVTLIVPCYNEEARIDVEQFINFLRQNGDVNIVFVDDGSEDNTQVVLEKIVKEVPVQASILSMPANSGKAEAVRQGMLHSHRLNANYAGYWDADLATNLEQVPVLLALLEDVPHRKVVCGSRIKRLGATIERKWYRHYSGRIIATFISMLLNLPTYDTQCGAKLFDSQLTNELFGKPFISPWLFDVEILARLIQSQGRKNALEMIYEHPLTSWYDIGESKVSIKYLPKIPLELTKIYFHYR